MPPWLRQIYRRDGGICQLKLRCDGVKVGWDHWHADHKVPHSKGGKSIVSNGQVACADCNFSKGANAPATDVA
jgi:5-methylcytosine-specific restriction endonuclease McrA